MEQGSTSSPLLPKPFCKPSAYSDAPEAEYTENIKHDSSPPPPEPFPEPSPEPQEPESEPLTSSGITRTPAKTDELDRSISLLSLNPSQASNSFIDPIVPWFDMGLFLYDIGQRIEKVSSDGHCLLYSIMQALKLNHDIHINYRTIANRIWKEINERIVFYVHFICGERNKPDNVLEDVHKYIEEKDYTIPVADLTLRSLAHLAPLKSLITLYINICKITFFPSMQFAYIYIYIYIYIYTYIHMFIQVYPCNTRDI